MHILFLAGREIDYARNEVILRALQRLGSVDVVGETGRARSLLQRSIKIALRAIPKLLRKNYNLVYVGFYGHLLMFPVSVLSPKPVLFDAFVSTYDTLVGDRKKISAGSFAGKFSLWLDRFGCRHATHILLDTDAHREYFIQSIRVQPNLVSTLPVGCNEDIFFPRQRQEDSTKTQVLYYSTYLPLHGVETVIRAAYLLRAEPIFFQLVGDGQEYQRIKNLSNELNLQNVTFLPSVPATELSDMIAEADICLGGHFGESAKAGRVIPGKIYQMLAMAKPVIATSTAANKELLVHGESAYFCPPANPLALSDAIMTLHQDQSYRFLIAEGGRKRYERDCSEAVITNRLKQIITQIIRS
jgi:glycosyltransferase involved in cell wall biosynthesis